MGFLGCAYFLCAAATSPSGVRAPSPPSLSHFVQVHCRSSWSSIKSRIQQVCTCMDYRPNLVLYLQWYPSTWKRRAGETGGAVGWSAVPAPPSNAYTSDLSQRTTDNGLLQPSGRRELLRGIITGFLMRVWNSVTPVTLAGRIIAVRTGAK